MASCSLGVSNIKISATNINKARLGNSLILNEQRPWPGQRPVKYIGLKTSVQSVRAKPVSVVQAAEAAASTNVVEDSEETKSSGLTSQLILKSSEVEALVTEICDSTSIAEFELKLGGFRLYVARNIADNRSPVPHPVPAAISESANVEVPDTNGSASSTSLAITKSASSSGGMESLVDKATDESLVILRSPKVGFFRISRTIKGKRAPPSCAEKQVVKEGQVLCYIEQLGGQIPIESDVSGEVVKIVQEDGDPVGYNDALIKILPSFPGIKKLQ